MDEKHISVSIHSDASDSGWGGTLERQGHPRQETHGYWDDQFRQLPIAAREAQALLLTLTHLLANIRNVWVDAFVDNQVALHSWERQTSKSPRITSIMKEMFLFCSAHQISLSVLFVPSKLNIADGLSRLISDLDAKLSIRARAQNDSVFGPHSIDLMAIPENVQMTQLSRPPSPFLLPNSLSWSCRHQRICSSHFSGRKRIRIPPFNLVGALLKFLRDQDCVFSIVVPDLRPRRYWWPILCCSCSSSLLLGHKGDSDVLLFPSRSRNTSWLTRPLQWDLWMFRIPSLLFT